MQQRTHTPRRRIAATLATVAGALLLVPAALGAQQRSPVTVLEHPSRDVPPGHLPPPGECRVWYDDRPAGSRPRPRAPRRGARRRATAAG